MIGSHLTKGLLIAPEASRWEVALEVLDKYSTRITPKFFTRRFQKQLEYSPAKFDTAWLGVPIVKKPQDCWVYQEMIWETKPQFLIEAGSYKGGSALFFASLFDLIGEGRVVTIDVNDVASHTLSHPRVTALVGSSVSDEIVSQVRRIVGNQTAMVSLDSNHSKDHVLKEIELYSEFVSLGKYLVVEDTGIRGRGPGEAAREFLRHSKDFVPDGRREKFMVTSCRGSFLKRIRA